MKRYRTLFIAFQIRPQDVLLWLPNCRLYIGPHVQEYRVGLDSEREEHLTRWVLAVQNGVAYKCRAASVSGSRGGTTGRSSGIGEQLAGKEENGAWILLIEPRRTPRSPEAEMSRHWDAREFPRQNPAPLQQHSERPRVYLLARKVGR